MTTVSPKEELMRRKLAVLFIALLTAGLTAGFAPSDAGWGGDPPPLLRP
jgi:hypothetical protein